VVPDAVSSDSRGLVAASKVDGAKHGDGDDVAGARKIDPFKSFRRARGDDPLNELGIDLEAETRGHRHSHRTLRFYAQHNAPGCSRSGSLRLMRSVYMRDRDIEMQDAVPQLARGKGSTSLI
jgi:hypothetical protein